MLASLTASCQHQSAEKRLPRPIFGHIWNRIRTQTPFTYYSPHTPPCHLRCTFRESPYPWAPIWAPIWWWCTFTESPSSTLDLESDSLTPRLTSSCYLSFLLILTQPGLEILDKNKYYQTQKNTVEELLVTARNFRKEKRARVGDFSLFKR